MRFTSTSATVFLCLCGLLAAAKKHEREQDFTELLFLKHLPDGRVLASFEFTTTWDIHPLTFTQPHTGEVVWWVDSLIPRPLPPFSFGVGGAWVRGCMWGSVHIWR